jgi:hypothetical protein
MIKDELLRLLLAAADDTDRVFDHSETDAWPTGALDAFSRLGLLRRAQTGLTAPCPNCTQPHFEPVIVVEEPGRQDRYFIWCPESMRVEVPPEMCQGWEIDPQGIAQAVACAMDLKGSPKALVPDRLWRLGRIPWEGKTREVLFARRLGDPDGASVAAHVGAGGRSIVLVPFHVPDERIWPERVPAVVALSHVAAVENEVLAIDGIALAERVVAADALAEARSVLPIDPEVKKQVVRRQVKAEIKSHLEDDVLIAARVTHGSTRKAAKALTDQLGRPVSKDQVQRAIDRAGGLDALVERDDSPSVMRTVASQSRDRAKKTEQYRK